MQAEKIITALGNGNVHEASRRLGIPVTTLHSWKRRASVPEWRQDHIRFVARKYGVSVDDGMKKGQPGKD